MTNNNVPNTSFKGGIHNVAKSASKSVKEIKTMKEQIKKMVNDILQRAEREVPEYGEFTPVYEEFKNMDAELVATDFMLKITKPPKNIENHQTRRYLEVVAYKLPLPIKSTRIIAAGTKEEIIKALKDETLCEKIDKAARELSDNLIDV